MDLSGCMSHSDRLDDGNKNIIGRELYKNFELAVFQQQRKSGKCVGNIDNSTGKLKQAIAPQFPELVSGIGLPRTHIVKYNFHQKFTATPQKGNRVQITLQPRVTAELDRLQKEGHIEKNEMWF